MTDSTEAMSTADLLDALRKLKDANPKAVKTSTHIYPARLYDPSNPDQPDRRITSWKLTEHMFFLSPSPFPVLARGLFTEVMSDGDQERIVARGYDKFFNTNEVDWTYWADMARYTDGPYHLTLKTNGCLILVSALSETELVVASKHSLGTTTEPEPEQHKHEEGSPVDQSRVKQRELLHEGLPAESSKAARDKAAATSLDSTVGPVTAQLDEASFDSKSQFKKALKNAARAELKEAKSGKGKEKDEGKPDQKIRTNEEDDHQQSLAHAEVGRQWLHKMLVAQGLAEADLARRLWKDKLSAVFELCDDDFEEHVIATPAHQTGLNLHGLNHNTPSFDTEDPSTVASFAEEFGFIPTPHISLPTLIDVKKYTDKVAESGAWEGDMIEGFVVRSRVRAEPRSTDDEQVKSIAAVTAKNDKKKRIDHGKPPYAPGAPFFFKVKFEEPYLLYRTWREITRTLLPLLDPTVAESLKGDKHPARRLGKKLQRPEAALYADWCQEMFKKNPKIFEGYDKGVVRVREAFLAWTEGEGRERWSKAKAGVEKTKSVESSIADKRVAMEKKKEGKPVKWVIVPVAIPGCGKTMIGVSLSELFGFAHTQSDDVTTKKTASGFLTNITNLLLSHDVVYADRNNHIEKHYSELVDLNSQKKLDAYNIKTLALVWNVDDLPYHRALRLCSERIAIRGDNHQTLRADLSEKAEHQAVVGQFLRKFEQPSEGIFTQCASMMVENDLEESITLATKHTLAIPTLSLAEPSMDNIRQAVRAAQGYTVTTPKREIAKIAREPRYYGVAPEIDLEELVRKALTTQPCSSASEFFEKLVAAKRITPQPHITLVHEKNVATEAETTGPGPIARLWDVCKSMQTSLQLPLFAYDMGLLIWDGRVMTLSVENLRTAEGHEAADLKVDAELTRSLHVTVGTASEEIPAFESRALVWAVRAARDRGEKHVDGVQWIEVEGLTGEGRILGMS